MQKFYTAKNDLVFKTIMLTKQNVLKKIIESVLEEEIKEMKILNNELTVINIKSKKRVVDILVQIQNQYIDVEMNNNPEEYINIRNGTYLFNMINESIGKGGNYTKMLKNEYIGINLTYQKGGSEIRNEYKLQKRNGEAYIKNFKIIEINMEKLNKEWYTLSEQEREKFKYLEMLDLNQKSLERFTKGDRIMKEYEEIVKKLNKDSEFRMHITEEEDERLIFESSMELAVEKGLQKGLEKGLKKGEKQKALAIAQKMLNKGKSVAEVKEFTDLSIEEIKSLLN